MDEIVVTRELLERFNRPGPRYTSYPTVPIWTEDFDENDYRRALEIVARQPDETLSVYVHLPFCAERCAYCGCNATVTRRHEVVDTYLDRVEIELALVGEVLGSRRQVVQLHWGGGTPNFLTPAQTERMFKMLDKTFEIDRDGEISLEMDPRIGSREQLEHARELGFNRVSLGVQDIEPQVQQAIGRIQPFEQTEALYNISRELNFTSVNLDIVYGLPYQTSDTFRRTLRAVIEMRPDRIACFSYAHVPWVKPNQKQVDASVLPEPYAKFGLFRQAINVLTASGYDWVGMDHFARHNDEMAVAARERRLHRNFMGYTVKPAPHMLAFGMSSIGDLAGVYVQNDAKLGGYQRTLNSGHLPVVRGYWLSEDDRLRRMAIMHLMCNLELPFELTRAEFGIGLDEALGDSLHRLTAYIDEGFVEVEPGRLVVTPLGRFFIRNLGMELDAHLGKTAERQIFSKTV